MPFNLADATKLSYCYGLYGSHEGAETENSPKKRLEKKSDGTLPTP